MARESIFDEDGELVASFCPSQRCTGAGKPPAIVPVPVYPEGWLHR